MNHSRSRIGGRVHTPLVVVAFSLAACSSAGHTGDEAAGPGFFARDSAGVCIIDNHRPRWGDLDPWTVDPEPALQLGVVDGDPDQMFARVVDALRLADGTIVVADGGDLQLRFYDPEGRLLGVAGREGEGPGEFSGITQLATCGGDSVIVWDPWLSRASLFSARGEFVRSFALEAPPPSRLVYGRWDCRGDVMVLIGWPQLEGSAPILGLHRPSQPIGLASARNGRITVSLGEFPGDDRYGMPGGSGPAPLGRRTLVAMGDGLVFVGTADDYEIRGYRLTGDLAFSIADPARAERSRTRIWPAIARPRWFG